MNEVLTMVGVSRVPKFRNKFLISLTILTFFLSESCSHTAFNEVSNRAHLESYRAHGTKVMAVSDKPLVAAIGVEIMRKGGNAFDAFAAMSFAVSVVAPHSTGLGGGGFALYRVAGHSVESRDFRERAPARATAAFFLKTDESARATVNGPTAIGVPGLVRGVLSIHKDHGKLSRAEVMKPAIELAEQGVVVDADMAEALEERGAIIQKFPASQKIFCPESRCLKEGEILIQKDLAQTLRTLAKEGDAAFYSGSLAKAIASSIEKGGGLLRGSDLKNYKLISREPVRGTYRDATIWSMGLPSSGGMHLVQMLNMLESADLRKSRPHSAQYTHMMSEIMRRAYRDRSVFDGDPSFVKVPVAQLTSKAYAQDLMSSVDSSYATKSNSLGKSILEKERVHTTNFSVMDSEGNVIVSTQSVNTSFGSCFVPPGTGIIMNNTMDDFAIAPGVKNSYGLIGGSANAIAPGKTPLSSMTPTIVEKNGRVWLTLGAPGGSQIITSVLQAFIHTMDYGYSIGDAVSLKRIHHQFVPDQIRFDPGALSSDVKHDLEKRGHVLNELLTFAYVSGIERLPDGSLDGAVDPKSQGAAAGF